MQEIVDPVVVDETDAVGYLIGQAERLGIDVADEDVAHVVDAHLAYLERHRRGGAAGRRERPGRALTWAGCRRPRSSCSCWPTMA